MRVFQIWPMPDIYVHHTQIITISIKYTSCIFYIQQGASTITSLVYADTIHVSENGLGNYVK